MTPETRAALALIEAGVSVASVDRVLRMVDVSSTDDQAAINAKVAELREAVPGAFAGPGAPPAKPPSPGPDGESLLDRGRRLARERFDATQPKLADAQDAG